jgi:hypothetical protein
MNAPQLLCKKPFNGNQPWRLQHNTIELACEPKQGRFHAAQQGHTALMAALQTS